MEGESSPIDLPRACPSCLGTMTFAFEKNGYSIFCCDTCGNGAVDGEFGASHVKDNYDDKYFFGGGAGYPDYLSEAGLLRDQGMRYGQLLCKYAKPGRLLDVGSAAGFIQAGLSDAGWSTLGLEPNRTMARHAEDVLGLKVVQGTIEGVGELGEFEAVCLIQVIGHFHDLASAMESVARLTRKDGYCLVEYWRMDSPLARLFGHRWQEYSPPSVLYWFTRAGLNALMGRHGFEPVARGAPKKYITLGHATSLIKYLTMRSRFSGLLTKPLDLFPADLQIRYPAFDLEWQLFRKL